MVLPAPTLDDPVRPGEAWLEALILNLRLSRRGVLLLVDEARPERIGELARALVAEHPGLDVITELHAFEKAPPGATLLLSPRPEHARWLNLNRPILSTRQIKLVLWCDRETTLALRQHAPDFFDWISEQVVCPEGPLPYAVSALRSARECRSAGVCWRSGEDADSMARLAAAVRAAAPDDVIHWTNPMHDYNALVQAIDDFDGFGLPRTEQFKRKLNRVAHAVHGGVAVWVASVAPDERSMWRFRWALAEAAPLTGRPAILVSPNFRCPGFVEIEARQLPLAEATRRLAEAGAARAGILACLVELHPGAVDAVVRAIRSGEPEQGLIDQLVSAADFTEVARPLVMSPDSEEPVPPAAAKRSRAFAEIEAALKKNPSDAGWMGLALRAAELGETDVAERWALRSLERDGTIAAQGEELAARLIRYGERDRADRVGRAARSRLQEDWQAERLRFLHRANERAKIVFFAGMMIAFVGGFLWSEVRGSGLGPILSVGGAFLAVIALAKLAVGVAARDALSSSHRVGTTPPRPDRGDEQLCAIEDLMSHYADNRHDAAEKEALHLIALAEEQHGADHPETVRLLELLGKLYIVQKKWAEARGVYQRLIGVLDRRGGLLAPGLTSDVVYFAHSYAHLGAARTAARLLRKALGTTELDDLPEPPEDLAALPFPFLEGAEGARVRHLLVRFLTQRITPLDADETPYARGALACALHTMGRHEEAELVIPPDSRAGP
ncbi:tetratricopeptide repeat protein [Sorangium sp. So ce429]